MNQIKVKKYKYISDDNYRVWKSIDSKTMQILKYHILVNNLSSEDYLFFNHFNKDKHISRFTFDDTLQKLCKIANISYVGSKKPHSHHFRHSFAVDVARTLKTPSDLIKLRNALEHSTIGMTEQYLQFSPEIKDTLEELYGEK